MLNPGSSSTGLWLSDLQEEPAISPKQIARHLQILPLGFQDFPNPAAPVEAQNSDASPSRPTKAQSEANHSFEYRLREGRPVLRRLQSFPNQA